MKLFRYALLLIVIVCSLSVASASAHHHNFTGTDEVRKDFFAMNTDVTDEVTSVFEDGYTTMDFIWHGPGDKDNPYKLTTNVQITGDSGTYFDTYPNVDEEGVWKVSVIENRYEDGSLMESNENGIGTFHVVAAPEFSFGTVIVLLFGSVAYITMRRSLLGS